MLCFHFHFIDIKPTAAACTTTPEKGIATTPETVRRFNPISLDCEKHLNI